jgi:ankyrin repeat protein
MSSPTLANLAHQSKLTIQHINQATAQELDESEDENLSVIYWACRNCSKEIVQALINKGVNFNKIHTRSYNLTPLMGAASYDRWDIVILLLQKGADVKAETTNGWTAFRCAVSQGAPPNIIDAFLTAGAELNLNPVGGEIGGDTLIDVAESFEKHETAQYLRNIIQGSAKSANFIA